jgi:hypothetical protein
VFSTLLKAARRSLVVVTVAPRSVLEDAAGFGEFAGSVGEEKLIAAGGRVTFEKTLFVHEEAALEDGACQGAGDFQREGVSLFVGIVDAVAGLLFQDPDEGGFVDEGAEGVASAQGFPRGLDAGRGGFDGE